MCLCVCLSNVSHSVLKELCANHLCACAWKVRESGCRNQVMRKSNTWLHGVGGFQLKPAMAKDEYSLFLSMCVYVRLYVFAQVLLGFINDPRQCLR